MKLEDHVRPPRHVIVHYQAIMNLGTAPTNATQAKERLYFQLAGSLGRMSRAIGQTADLCEHLQVDLHAMRVFAGLDAAKCVMIVFSITV